jgi:hypothetical protein
MEVRSLAYSRKRGGGAHCSTPTQPVPPPLMHVSPLRSLTERSDHAFHKMQAIVRCRNDTHRHIVSLRHVHNDLLTLSRLESMSTATKGHHAEDFGILFLKTVFSRGNVRVNRQAPAMSGWGYTTPIGLLQYGDILENTRKWCPQRLIISCSLTPHHASLATWATVSRSIISRPLSSSSLNGINYQRIVNPRKCSVGFCQVVCTSSTAAAEGP